VGWTWTSKSNFLSDFGLDLDLEVQLELDLDLDLDFEAQLGLDLDLDLDFGAWTSWLGLWFGLWLGLWFGLRLVATGGGRPLPLPRRLRRPPRSETAAQGPEI
jgi:hypothetical protein